MRRHILASMIWVLSACSPMQGTEVGNGLKPESPDTNGNTPNGTSDGPQQPPSGRETQNNVESNEVYIRLLASHCHSLIQSSRDRLPQLMPLSVENSLPIAASQNASAVKELSVRVVEAKPRIFVGAVEVQRELPSSQTTRCIGQESISIVEVANGGKIVVLESRIGLADGEFKIRIERFENDSAATLRRVELGGPDNFQIDWQ